MPAAPSIGSLCHLTGRAAELDVESCPVSYNRLSSLWLRSHVADHAAGVARDERFGSNDAHLVNQKMAKIGRMQSWI